MVTQLNISRSWGIIYLLVLEVLAFATYFYLVGWSLPIACALTLATTWAEELLSYPNRITVQLLSLASLIFICGVAGIWLTTAG